MTDKEKLERAIERLLSDKATLEQRLIEPEFRKVKDELKKEIEALTLAIRILEMYKVNWLPTAENISALPEPIRKYIGELETNADPLSMIRDNTLLRENCKALEIKVERERKHWGELREWTKTLQKFYATTSPNDLLDKMQSIEEGE